MKLLTIYINFEVCKSVAKDLPSLSMHVDCSALRTNKPSVPCADYSIEENAYWSERVYSHVFRLLNEYGILMEGMLLKPNMCLPGRKSSSQ